MFLCTVDQTKIVAVVEKALFEDLQKLNSRAGLDEHYRDVTNDKKDMAKKDEDFYNDLAKEYPGLLYRRLMSAAVSLSDTAQLVS